ncbi:AAA family ATPase [Microvenator marinus]|jgi:chromosome partitioning protein|nr:AAA family ATPase [Microvenator marinus]
MSALKKCNVCSTEFFVKYRWQLDNKNGQMRYFCSQECEQKAREEADEVACSTCDKRFTPKYAYQAGTVDGRPVYFCSMECRTPTVQEVRKKAEEGAGPMRIAILNQKGGTGKTTTTVSLAAGLAEAGHRVLVIDVDSQGHVGVSLGVEGKHTIYHVVVEEIPLERCVVRARPNLDILIGNETLASAEIVLARMNEGRDRALRDRLEDVSNYDFVLLDCGPSLSLLNMNALTFADHLIVPVSCDYLSLVGVKQVMKTLKNVNQVLLHPITVLGILPTFYDMRNNISDESVRTLKGYFQDKVLPPIRVNTKLKEAPSLQKTIFEFAPESRGASDYQKVVDWLLREKETRFKKSA